MFVCVCFKGQRCPLPLTIRVGGLMLHKYFYQKRKEQNYLAFSLSSLGLLVRMTSMMAMSKMNVRGPLPAPFAKSTSNVSSSHFLDLNISCKICWKCGSGTCRIMLEISGRK